VKPNQHVFVPPGADEVASSSIWLRRASTLSWR